MGIEWRSDVEAGEWIVERLHPFAHDVGSVIPDGYEAYARLFHPVDDQSSQPTRWSDLAHRNGRIVHPEMQFHLVRTPVGAEPSRNLNDYVNELSWGSLPRPELAALAQVLEHHTDTPQACWFAVWEGFGQLHGAGGWLTKSGQPLDPAGPPPIAPPEVLAGPRLRMPNRHFLLLRGLLAEVADLHDDLGRQSPNLWWPDDRAWCVATGIDFAWTYVAGTQRLIDELLADPALEALPVKLTDRFAIDSDQLNAALNP